jgi:DNA modification methylase
MNQLILGDNLEVLKRLDNESVDLVYLDPPFFSNRNYEVIWGDEGEVRSFRDRWSGGMSHYIDWLKERVQEMHRILKPTGSLFLHCDYHANAYIRIEILDKIFGTNNFRNEIIWKRNFTKKGSQYKMSRYAINTDTIFFYSKSDKYSFTTPKVKNLKDEELYKIYDKVDENGRRYKSEPIELPKMMARKNLIFEYQGYTPEFGWMMNIDKLEELNKLNKIYFTKNGKPRRKNFADDYKGSEVDNIWTDIQPVGQVQSEIIGYPTQKPEALLQRIIESASNEGDTILDPFVGGGTTIAAAEMLNRKWLGIDQSVQAIKVTDLRLQNKKDLFSQPYVVQLYKYDYDELRNKPAFEFERWIVEQYGGQANIKQRGDFGIDGKTADGTPLQVKRSDNISREVIDKFPTAAERFDARLFERNRTEGKPIGFIIAFSFGKGAIEEVARLKNQKGITIKLIKVADIVPIAHKPKLKLNYADLGVDKKGLREIEFIAQAETGSGIEFYAWDWHYKAEQGFKAEIIIDKEGKQTQKFKAGTHTIAVRVIDNEGLENTEVVTLKINGVIEKK